MERQPDGRWVIIAQQGDAPLPGWHDEQFDRLALALADAQDRLTEERRAHQVLTGTHQTAVAEHFKLRDRLAAAETEVQRLNQLGRGALIDAIIEWRDKAESAEREAAEQRQRAERAEAERDRYLRRCEDVIERHADRKPGECWEVAAWDMRQIANQGEPARRKEADHD